MENISYSLANIEVKHPQFEISNEGPVQIQYRSESLLTHLKNHNASKNPYKKMRDLMTFPSWQASSSKFFVGYSNSNLKA